MTQQTNLDNLIASMQPVLDEETYVFATTANPVDIKRLKPIMMFEESEGKTLILPRAQAQGHGIATEFPCCRITLNVHSSLDAVGFIAKVSAHLATAGISVNPVSGFFHDHLFVPQNRAVEAMRLLRALSKG